MKYVFLNLFLKVENHTFCLNSENHCEPTQVLLTFLYKIFPVDDGLISPLASGSIVLVNLSLLISLLWCQILGLLHGPNATLFLHG